MYLNQQSYVINHADAQGAMQGIGDIQGIVGWQNGDHKWKDIQDQTENMQEYEKNEFRNQAVGAWGKRKQREFSQLLYTARQESEEGSSESEGSEKLRGEADFMTLKESRRPGTSDHGVAVKSHENTESCKHAQLMLCISRHQQLATAGEAEIYLH
ncbi:hypothetical protein Anapl_11674 [Anas platyrhynchos]|uniref:Uncharacterized protein n=1 Tax=Anas platyrhynchos TaxID=8839 RepID=R0KX87_ANAPL|nr:hypothetical protein Anapl_11674 [Anas platyrhynchos]